MAKRIHKVSSSQKRTYGEQHRFEHWYVSNQVYFITARCRDRHPAFAADAARAVFWDRFEHYTRQYEFTPWVTSLVVNHYHVLGYCKDADGLGQMMRKIHGSIAKLVNDVLPARRVPFWTQGSGGHGDYFDGCLRDEKQCRAAYRYVLTQCVRHGICADWREYPDTHVTVDLDRGARRAHDLKAFLEGIPYKRYLSG